MSLVTRCPACGTHFKVVRDQLRVSDGWVRCGRCSQVFDASLALQELLAGEPDAAVAAETGAPAAARSDAAIASPELAAPSEVEEPSAPTEPERWPASGMLELQAQAPAPSSRPVPLEPAPAMPYALIADDTTPAGPASAAAEVEAARQATPSAPVPLTSAPAALASRPAPLASVPAALASRPAPLASAPAALASRPASLGSLPMPLGGATGRVETPFQRALRRTRAKAEQIVQARQARLAAAAAEPRAEDASDPAAPEPQASAGPPTLPSFLKEQVRRRARRRDGTARPLAQMAIVLAVALLLVLQVVRHERDVLVARQPSLRPALAWLCAISACEVAALRRIGSITIDGAAFARERGDGYRLSFTLRNEASMPLAMPSIELSLLDTQERPVVRRVISPAEFGAPPVLAARAERAASLALALTGDGGPPPAVAGYRVVAFYP